LKTLGIDFFGGDLQSLIPGGDQFLHGKARVLPAFCDGNDEPQAGLDQFYFSSGRLRFVSSSYRLAQFDLLLRCQQVDLPDFVQIVVKMLCSVACTHNDSGPCGSAATRQAGSRVFSGTPN
jgi:hypothetical protein